YSLFDFMEKINSLFPLPPKPEHMCHDEFLTKLLAPYELEKKKKVQDTVFEIKSSTSEMDEETAFRVRMYKVNVTQRARSTMNRSTVKQSILSEEQRNSALLTKAMFQVRFANLISDFRNVCIIYQMLQLQEILNVMREFPPAGTNPNDTIFGWSYKSTLKRFEQQTTTVYVDILEKNRTEATLDNLKFYVDLGELINLVQALLNDVINNRDLCDENAFMEILRDTQVDMDSVIAGPYEKIIAEHESLKEQNAKKKIIGIHNAHLAAKQRALTKEQHLIDNLSPIETRYKVNWAYDSLEQGQHKDFLRCKVLTDELDKISEQTAKDKLVWKHCQVKYVTLIEQYKARINTVQEAFDEDMETAENMLQATTNRVNKCKEDLKTQMDKVEMFRMKVKEVHDKLAIEAEKERRRLSLARPSKRASQILAKQKALAKEAKLQEKLDLIKAKKLAKQEAKQAA
ncbi:hypothetical protein KR032_001055, partial [Drosophila birchii]